MRKNAEQKAEQTRTIRHTESGGHSVDREELLRSEKVRKVISEVAVKLKVSWERRSQRLTAEPTS